MGVSAAPVRVLRLIARLNVGGPAIHATLLTERLDPARFTTTLVTGTEEEGEANYLALHGRTMAVQVVPDLGREIRPLNDLRTVWRLMQIIRRERPHIVHTHTAKAGALGRVAAILCGWPVVSPTFHGHRLRAGSDADVPGRREGRPQREHAHGPLHRDRGARRRPWFACAASTWSSSDAPASTTA